MDSNRVSVQVYMSRDIRKQLRVMAAERDITINDLIRETLEKGFKSEGIEIDMSAGLEDRGGWRGGPKDKDKE
jgi:hypothetical protein